MFCGVSERLARVTLAGIDCTTIPHISKIVATTCGTIALCPLANSEERREIGLITSFVLNQIGKHPDSIEY
jgi:hypothetical protein